VLSNTSGPGDPEHRSLFDLHEARPTQDSLSIAWFAERFRNLKANVEAVLLGKSEVVHLALVCLLAEGHLLIDDVPGVGKTSLAKAIATSISGTVSRIQFTPDLLPSDVTGSEIWNRATSELEFRPGPVFANVVVADEINRAAPKTQSALLEVMEERQVTVSGESWPVARPFLVIATQNPVEFGGTYRLPEAQLDRFLMRLEIGYPSKDDEIDLALRWAEQRSQSELRPVLQIDEMRAMIRAARRAYMAPALARYCVELSTATRKLAELRLGASPRGSLALIAASQVHAAAAAQEFVTAENIRSVAPHVLLHRLVLTAEAEMDGCQQEMLVRAIMKDVALPTDRARR
jgi:MoxR-like ATPase